MAKKRRKTTTFDTLPSLRAERAPQIQLATGNAQRDHWRDPDDTSPIRRTAREITGFRRGCPLCRCRARHGDESSFTLRHIAAADLLRE